MSKFDYENERQKLFEKARLKKENILLKKQIRSTTQGISSLKIS